MLYARLEDMASAGIQDWEGLRRIEAARLVWDVDVVSPAQSGNLIAYIPGEDPGQALILSAHIDSPNSTGALDNGSGSAILLEILRYLNGTETIPPVDLVFVWFGSEEIGLYGSFNFSASHQACSTAPWVYSTLTASPARWTGSLLHTISLAGLMPALAARNLPGRITCQSSPAKSISEQKSWMCRISIQITQPSQRITSPM